MLIKKIGISRLMIHVQQIEKEKAKESESESRSARTGSFDFFSRNLAMVIILNFVRSPQLHAHPLLVTQYLSIGHLDLSLVSMSLITLSYTSN